MTRTIRRIRRGYTSCRFGHLHYREAGEPVEGQPTLVLLHQNPSSSWEYEKLMEALAPHRHVIAFDTPGYGMSDTPPSPPGMAGYAEAFSDGLDALGLEGEVDLYGFHTGTLLAIELALLRRDKVRRIGLTGIPMYPEEPRAQRLKAAQETPEPDESGEVVLGLLKMLWDYIVVNRDKRVPLDRAVLAFSDKTYALERMHYAYLGVWSYDYSRLPELTQPVLLIQPHEDLLEVSLEAAKLIPNATVVELPDLDREIFEIAPERIAHELHNFLA